MTVPDHIVETAQLFFAGDPRGIEALDFLDALVVEGLIVYRDQLEQVDGNYQEFAGGPQEPVFRLRPTNGQET